MTAVNPIEENRNCYFKYVEIINDRNFKDLPLVVDPQKYQEICVGFTPGWVNFNDSLISIKKVLKGIPNLTAKIEETASEGNKVYARLKVTGTQTGSLFGAPATGKSFEIQMFDYVKIENGKIVERIQQSDTFGQFILLFKGMFIKLGIALGMIMIGLIIALILK